MRNDTNRATPPSSSTAPVAEWVNEEQGFQYLIGERLPDGTKLYAGSAPSTAPTVEVDERASFEAWWQERSLKSWQSTLLASEYGKPMPEGWGDGYKRHARQAWEGRAALASRPPAEAAGERMSINTPEFRALILNYMEASAGIKGHAMPQWAALIAYIDTCAARSAGTIERNLSATIGAMQADIDQLKADLKEARSGGDSLPAGLKLVPIEPTGDQLRVELSFDASGCQMGEIYRSMIGVAPAPGNTAKPGE
jgi:hypothetical protein